ncbi:MAG: hypothetical protein AAFR13_05225 [Pseudomonadota bacterium]
MDTFDTHSSQCPAAAYLSHEAGSLAINGYRHWLLGLVERDETAFGRVWSAHNAALGENLSRMAMEGLHGLVSQLENCGRCPMRFLRPKSMHLCREEGLVLGMIASIQNGHEAVTWRCATHLTCPRLAEQLIGAGGLYSMPLKAGGQTLLPFPSEIMGMFDQAQSEQAAGETYH